MGVALALLDPRHRSRRARVEQRARRQPIRPPRSPSGRSARRGGRITCRSVIYRILPEVILTLAGVLVMLVDPLLAAHRQPQIRRLVQRARHDRRTLRQRLAASSPARHRLLRRRPDRCLQRLLPSAHLRHRARRSARSPSTPCTEHADDMGEFFALMVFGAVGMLLMTSAVELLLVFIGLEISSISTYILAGFRKRTGKRPRSRHQVLPARLLRHGILPLRHRAHLRRHRHHAHRRHRRRASAQPRPRSSPWRRRPHPRRARLQGLRRALPRLDARRLRRRALARRRASCPPRPRPRPSPCCCASSTAPSLPSSSIGGASIWFVAVLSMTIGNLGRAAPAERQAHAGLLLHRPRRLSARRLRRALAARHRRRQLLRRCPTPP